MRKPKPRRKPPRRPVYEVKRRLEIGRVIIASDMYGEGVWRYARPWALTAQPCAICKQPVGKHAYKAEKYNSEYERRSYICSACIKV